MRPTLRVASKIGARCLGMKEAQMCVTMACRANLHPGFARTILEGQAA
jgi:hypothetical protein